MSSLVIELDAGSQALVRDRALLSRLRGDHVTLAHGVDRAALDPAWIPGGAKLGERVAFSAVAEVADARVQALRIEIRGSSLRPHDGGVLHLTVSRAEGARSSEANALLGSGVERICRLELAGVVGWRE